ncbi:hypothetical protein [Maribacter sp. 2304DJ31-5]|uniref:hypothetical protein n=1 Tax=Maribacter sp. 2304DJ31-5 TaxID=3386273 RepID=UPI0039BC3B29
MKKKDEFYIGYVDTVGEGTKKTLKRFVLFSTGSLLLAAFLFSFFQRPSVTSSFDFNDPTKVSGIYHESPYPMLRTALADTIYKDIVLLGFGKSGANPYLDKIREKEGSLVNRHLTIEGQLIYYNGKTLLEIDDSQKITLNAPTNTYFEKAMPVGNMKLEGEIIDPKCYFGVMKPGFGKIHRSCAALCISGGIPPVLATNTQNGIEDYFLLTDLKGNPIHKDIIPYIGQPSIIKGEVYKLEDWYVMQIDVSQIEKLDKKSIIY